MTSSTDSLYATAEEKAAVMRQATPNEIWLNGQLDRIDPHRHEMGSAGDTPALVKLVFELRDVKTTLQGEAGVMRTLLDAALTVLHTIDPDDDDERANLDALKRDIHSIVEMRVVRT